MFVWVNSEKHLLSLSFFGFEPEETSATLGILPGGIFLSEFLTK